MHDMPTGSQKTLRGQNFSEIANFPANAHLSGQGRQVARPLNNSIN
jgi:hypothetical protein